MDLYSPSIPAKLEWLPFPCDPSATVKLELRTSTHRNSRCEPLNTFEDFIDSRPWVASCDSKQHSATLSNIGRAMVVFLKPIRYLRGASPLVGHLAATAVL